MPLRSVPYRAMPAALRSVGCVCSISPTTAAMAVAYAPGGWDFLRSRFCATVSIFSILP